MFRFLHHDPLYKKVEPLLTQIAAGKHDAESLIKMLKQFLKLTYVKRSYFKRIDNFDLAVLSNFGNKICPVYSKIAAYILSHKPEGIALLLSSHPMEQTLRKPDILLILCLMSTFLIPPQQYEADKKLQSEFTHIKHFGYIFSHEKTKAIGILEYLNEELQQVKHTNLTIYRKVTTQSVKQLLQKSGKLPMQSLKISEDTDDIESHYGALKVDFANKYIGGGSLTHGSVQEEIMFTVRPELYTTMLLCEKMANNEALVLVGYQKYFDSEGYGANVSITGRNKHKYGLDMEERPQQYITAIDSINFNRTKIVQFSPQAVNRDLLKAYTGFNVEEVETIVSGNWGCGVFGGDLQLKIIIQWLAASLARKPMIYCPFGKSKCFSPQQCLYKLSGKRISDVYDILIKACIRRSEEKFHAQNKPIFQQILQLIGQH